MEIRTEEPMDDQQMRDATTQVLREHRSSLTKVRGVLNEANETLADEIKRLDAILEEKKNE